MPDTYSEVIIVLVAGILIFLVFSGVVIFILLFYQKKKFLHVRRLLEIESATQKEILKTQLETREETYRQIAEELHDNIGQMLSSAKVLLAVTERSLPTPPTTLLIAHETLAKAIQDLRSLSKTLSPEWLEQFNIIDNLQTEAERIRLSRLINVRLHSNTNVLPLDGKDQVILFRIIQEVLQNCIRHAQASEITISVVMEEKTIAIEVGDNGKGLPASKSSTGLGMLNIKNRTKLLGGEVEWATRQEGGTTVSVLLPL
jgi:signal transduction histidine kinase